MTAIKRYRFKIYVLVNIFWFCLYCYNSNAYNANQNVAYAFDKLTCIGQVNFFIGHMFIGHLFIGHMFVHQKTII